MKKLLILGLGAALTSASMAQIVTGFEASPTETPGWNFPTTSFTANGWSGNLSATQGFSVSSLLAHTGSQSAMANFQSTGSSNYRADTPSLGSTNKVGTASAKVLLASTAANGTTTGTGRQYGLFGNGSGAGYAIYLQRANTTDVDIYTYNAATFSATKVGTLANKVDQWVDMSLTVDLINKAAYANVNGTNYVIRTGWTPASFDAVTGISLFSRGVISAQGIGRAHFDQYSAAAVPEPASMIALGAGALALIRRKRSK